VAAIEYAPLMIVVAGVVPRGVICG
jgi:hypothetical protein